MDKLEFIDAPAPEMRLIMQSCAAGLDDFCYASNQIFVNQNLKNTPDPLWHTQIEWKNKLGDELDGFFDGWCNNGLYETSDGRLWAVDQIYVGDKFAPLYWREVCNINAIRIRESRKGATTNERR